jgi:hypothetical protein
MLLLDQEYYLYSESTCRLCASRKLCADFKTKKFDPLHPSERPCIMSERSLVNNIRPNDVRILSGLLSMSRNFE